jgi:membrane protein YdbS with pleckstrin-like domain
VETVPFVRVQHARISQGPIERSFGLATLEVNSAGPDLHIHGLPADDAERLKIVVVERAGDLAEEL